MTEATASPETWLQEYGDMLYRYALIRVRSEHTAEDLVQETLLSGIQSFSKFNGKSAVSTWLVSILKFKIIDLYRKTSRESPLADLVESEEQLMALQFNDRGHWQVDLVDWVSPDKSLADQQFWKVFHQCLERLPENKANLFVLSVLEGLSSEDCCKVLGLNSTNQLWVNLSRIRMKLRQCLEVYWFENGNS